MMEKTFASLFTGFGLADVGAIGAGYLPVWGIEYDSEIAGVANTNLGGHVRIQDILDADPSDFETLYLLHASPPCPSFSTANRGRGETEDDIALARAVCGFLRVLRPPAFTLENVMAYRKSQSFAEITKVLDELGYWWGAVVLDASDYSVPQSRRRLFVRARLGAMLKPLPPKVRPKVGWYQAIEDLIPGLPESRFAEWQMKRLPKYISGSFTVDSAGFPDEDGVTVPVMRQANEPINTIVANYHRRRTRAFLVGGANTSDKQAAPGVGASEAGEPTLVVTPQSGRNWRAFINFNCGSSRPRGGDEPVSTVDAMPLTKHPRPTFIVDDQNSGTPDENGECGLTIRRDSEPVFTVSATQTKRRIRAWLESGRVVAMTPRCLARFQTMPDWYVLPDDNKLACKGIGNGVPCELYKIVAESMIGE